MAGTSVVLCNAIRCPVAKKASVRPNTVPRYPPAATNLHPANSLKLTDLRAAVVTRSP